MPLANVCEACRKNNHRACANAAACVCAFRGHPQIPEQRFPLAGEAGKCITVDDSADRSLQARHLPGL